jgi:hypothetical protein
VVLINETRQTLHLWRYKEAHPCNHCCSGKALTITYYKHYPVCSARVPYCYLWPARIYSFFSTLSHKWHDFWKKKVCWTHNMYFDFLYNFCLKHFSFSEDVSEIWSKTITGLDVKYLLFFSDSNENWIFWHNLEKYSNMRFHENASRGRLVVSWGRKDRGTDRQTWRR